MVQFGDALQMMWLQTLHLDVKVPHLCSEVVVLIEIWSSPLVVQFYTLSSSSLVFWLLLTRIVHVEFMGCMKDVFKPFLLVKVAETVFVFSLALNRMGSNKSNSAIAGSLTLRPNRCSTGVLPIVFEVLRCVISALCRNASNDTLRFGLYVWSARFTFWTALSASSLALGYRRLIPFSFFSVIQTTVYSHHLQIQNHYQILTFLVFGTLQKCDKDVL